MSPNSEPDAKAEFFDLFLTHWKSGTGRPPEVGGNRPSWTTRQFHSAMEKAGGDVSADTLANWRSRANVPQSQQAAHMLKVFFPNVTDGEGPSPEGDEYRALLPPGMPSGTNVQKERVAPPSWKRCRREGNRWFG